MTHMVTRTLKMQVSIILSYRDVTNKATAANVMQAVAVQPSRFNQKPLVCSPMTFRLLPTSMTKIKRGGARTPFNTADQKSMRIGFVLNRSRIIAMTMAPARTR